jgi:1-propanol dehydrogenase
MQRFFCQTELRFGPDALQTLQQEHAGAVLVVSDPFFAKNGEANRIGALVPNATVTVFGEVSPDPTLELAVRGLKMQQQCAPDLLIALGGGSAIDCAKAMICLSEPRPRFIAIPTTSGTGSEVTSFSILTHNGVKYPLIDRSMVPDCAILDESLLQKLPASVAADAGMDVLAHCLEAVAATGATPLTDALATGSFHTVLRDLPASVRGDTSVRGRIHLAATMAGLAFDHAGLGACHALSHALGGAFHVPHGRLNAILLPCVLSCNAVAAGTKYLALAQQCGLGCGSGPAAVRSLCAALRRLRKTLQMPDTLQQAGISSAALAAQMPQLLDAAMADACLQTNPKSVSPRDLQMILEEAMQHG